MGGGAVAPDGAAPDPRIAGVGLDPRGRCAHWRGPLDVVAIRLPCCAPWWACHACHEAVADHPARPWPRDRFDEAAVLCGACGATLAIRAYLEGGDACPACGAGFNPRCALHRPLYFEG